MKVNMLKSKNWSSDAKFEIVVKVIKKTRLNEYASSEKPVRGCGLLR